MSILQSQHERCRRWAQSLCNWEVSRLRLLSEIHEPLGSNTSRSGWSVIFRGFQIVIAYVTMDSWSELVLDFSVFFATGASRFKDRTRRLSPCIFFVQVMAFISTVRENIKGFSKLNIECKKSECCFLSKGLFLQFHHRKGNLIFIQLLFFQAH